MILRVGFFFWAVSIWKVIRRLCIPYVSLVGQSSYRPVSILENIQTKGSSLGPTFGFGPNTSCGNDLQYPKIHATKYPPKNATSNQGIKFVC